MSEIVWEEPPAQAYRRPGMWVHRLAPLRDQPGRWARFEVGTHGTYATTAYRIRKGAMSGVNEGEFETAGRVGAGTYYLYVRYVGEVQP